MNDMFKLFNKKHNNLIDVDNNFKTTNRNDSLEEDFDDDLINFQFNRSNRSYLSISKSGRMKSKKFHKTSTRILKDDLFAAPIHKTESSSSSPLPSTTAPVIIKPPIIMSKLNSSEGQTNNNKRKIMNDTNNRITTKTECDYKKYEI
jgi:hypothetical protein